MFYLGCIFTQDGAYFSTNTMTNIQTFHPHLKNRPGRNLGT